MRKPAVFLMLMVLLPVVSAYEIDSFTWGGDKYDGAVFVQPEGGAVFLVGSSESFTPERALFVAAIRNGKPLFARVYYTNAPVWAKDAVFQDGYVYVVGEMGDSTFNRADGFIAKLTLDGDMVFFKSLGRNYNDGINGVTVGRDGLYVAGYTYETGKDKIAFVAKLDFEGNVLWATDFGKAPLEAKAVALGDGIYVAATDGGDVYVSKFDATGDFLWAVKWPNDGRDEVYDLEFRDGTLYIAGSVENLAFGNGFLLELDDKLHFKSGLTFGLGYSDAITKVLFNGSKLLLVGRWGNFDTKTYDTFIASFDDGTLEEALTFTSTGVNFPTDAYFDGDLYIAGYSEGLLTFEVPNFTEVTRETIYNPLEANLVELIRGDLLPGKPAFTVKDVNIASKNVEGAINEPTKGDAMVIALRKEIPPQTTTTTSTSTPTSTTTTTPTPSTTTETTSTTTTTPTTTTTTPTSTTISVITKTVTVTQTSTTSTPTPSSTTTTTTSEKDGICGPALLGLFALLPTMARRR